tara:strand:- start:116 stop:523 length:408 start_codon:yes stop_codon:yes gene_type:complete
MKELIELLNGILNSMAEKLRGDFDDRLEASQDVTRCNDHQELAMYYCSLKILANAQNLEQIQDALGLFQEALDFCEEQNMIVLLEQAEQLASEKSKDVKALRSTLTETQIALAEERNKSKKLADQLAEELLREQI